MLHDGPETTERLKASITLRTPAGLNEYRFQLVHASGDSFIFANEEFRFCPTDIQEAQWHSLGAGHKESALIRAEGKTPQTISTLFRNLITYHFHNTTFGAPMRNTKADKDNGWFLEEDGRNMAAVLLELSLNQRDIYLKIVGILQQVLPFFHDFILEVEYGMVLLKWKEKNSTATFTASQASDGMLRCMALITLLCLPHGRKPSVIFLDEPEIGLHPSAILTISELIHAAAEQSQIFLATQNPDMLNCFSADEVVVVNRQGRGSTFEQLNEQDLSDWLEEYALSELWHKNILKGKP